MKLASTLFLVLGLTFGLWCMSDASEQNKEVTIKGTMACAKCGLMKEASCATVVVEKKDGKEVIYYFSEDDHTKYHGDVCPDTKPATVVGTVTEKDGKKTIAVKDVKFDSK